MLWSSEAAAQTASEEREREAAADHVMTLATEYVIGTTRSYPVMQIDVKENLQNASNGKIYVKLAPGGQLGIGSALAQKVQGGTINAGQFSLSNFAPFAPAVGALYAFGFKDILSHVTFTQAVPDSQTYACNLEWYNTLLGDVQEAIEWASEMSFHQNLAKVPSSRAFAMAEMVKSGVEFHSLSAGQLAEWQETVGYQRSEWDSFKTELAGSMETFDKLVEAAGTQGRYYVHDA